MRLKRFFMIMVLVLVAAGGCFGYSYQAERTPEYAMGQLMDGVKSRDFEKVKTYADVDTLLESTYDESTTILAEDIEKLNQLYPQDWFFRHDTVFMKQYIAERRGDDLVFIHRSLEFYMDPDIVPISRSDGQAKWISDEMTKFADSYQAVLKSVTKDGRQAVAVVEITGSDTEYGRLVPNLTLKAELEQQEDGHWRVVRIANVPEAFYPVVRGIEDYWTLQGWQ